MNRHIFFFHGLESGPHGSKYRALSEHFEVESPDFQGMDIDERLEKALGLTAEMTDLIIVGSSFGGLLAALLYARAPGRIFGYVLAAPALTRAADLSAMPSNAVVVHGVHDDVVPLEPVKAICARHGVDLIEVDDGHRLADSIDLLIEHTRLLVEARSAPHG